MPRMPLRELRPELFEDEYQTDSDDNGNDFDRSSGEMRNMSYLNYILKLIMLYHIKFSHFADSDADTAFSESSDDLNLDDLEMEDEVPKMGRIFLL